MRNEHISSPGNGLQNTAVSSQQSVTTNLIPRKAFQEVFPLPLRPGGRDHHRPALRTAFALMPQNKAGCNRDLSIDAGGTL